jgi:anti-anti-sigma factor
MPLLEVPGVVIDRPRRPEEGPGGAVVALRGSHDLATKAAVVEALDRAAQLDAGTLLVDLSEVTFMDGSTIGAIAATAAWLRARGRAIVLGSPSPAARRVVEICGFTPLVGPPPAAAHDVGPRPDVDAG